MQTKNQKGFAVLEGLLILVIVGILAGTGWYVMKAQKQTDAAYNAAANTTTPAKKASSASATKDQKYLVIKEWGIKIPLSKFDEGAYYKVDTDLNQSSKDATNITAYSSEVDSLTGPAGISCKGEYIAYLMRLPKDDPSWAPSASVDDGNVSPLFGERTVVGAYKYAIATKKQYGPDCFATSKTGDYIVDPTTSEKFDQVVKAFYVDFAGISAE